MSSIHERESKLWDDDAKVAERIVHWFDVLISVRKAADGADPAELMQEVRRIDPDVLWSDSLDVMTFMMERFQSAKAALDVDKKLIPRRATAEKNLKKKGATTRDLVLKRYLIHRDSYRTSPDAIPAKIAAEVTHGKKQKPLALGTVENILSGWRKKGRI